MNAPQFGVAANGPATPAANSSLFNFPTAGYTNSAIPDFKTIAASFFAAPTTTATAAPVETKSTSTLKPVGPLLSRAQKDDKGKIEPSPELPAAFLPIIPAHTFPTLTPQAPKQAEPMVPAKVTEAKEGSSAPIHALPLVDQSQNLHQILSSQLPTRVVAQSTPSAQQEQKSNDIKPAIAPTPSAQQQNVENAGASDETTGVAATQTKSPAEAFLNIQVEADNVQRGSAKNIGPATSTAELTKTAVRPQSQGFLDETTAVSKTQPHTDIATDSASTPRISEDEQTVPSVTAKNIGTGINTEIDSNRTNTILGQKSSSKIEKSVSPDESKKSTQTKQSVEPEKSSKTETKRTDSTVEMDQAPQQPAAVPQSIDDVLQAVAPQAVVLEHDVNGQAFGHPTNPQPTQSVNSAGKSGKTEANFAEATAFSPATAEKVSPEESDSPKTAPVVETNSKTITSKSKTDTTVKRAQRNIAENPTDAATASTSSHRQDFHAIGSPQDATSKDHDTITPQVNIGSHAKSVSAKNTTGTSDAGSASETQIADADDITPPSHTGINTAKLVQGLTQSELRVGLQTRDFGNIDIRTSASRHEFTAQISVEHSEVAHTLTSELPNLYARLNEQQVPVSNIHIHDQSLSTSSGMDQRSQQSSQQQSGGFTKQQAEPTLPAVHEVFSSTDRLDIRV